MSKTKFELAIHKFITQFDHVVADDSILTGHMIYRLDDKIYPIENPNQLIFTVVKLNSNPLQIDLACDSLLAKTLRARYESVMGSNIMSSKTWNHIVLTGELTESEVFDLIRLAYNLTLKFTQDLGLSTEL